MSISDKPPPNPAKEAKRRLIAKRYPPKKPSLKMVRIAKALYAPALALVVVVGAAAAGSGDGDYELILPGINDSPICAKSRADCEAAADAIYERRWTPLPPRDHISKVSPESESLVCQPPPDCFPAASLTIPGFNSR